MGAVAFGMDETLEQAGELGSVPAAAVEIRRIADDRTSSLRDLEKAVAMDPFLAARILKFANAAHYGLVRQVTDLRQAVVVLGMRAVRDVAIGMAVAARAAKLLEDEAEAFLRHSLYTAMIGQLLEVSGSQASHDAFVSGLLHDIGILVFMAVHQESYKKVLDRFPHESDRLCAAERVVYGFDHTALGAECLDRWQLPGRVVHAVRNHHAPVIPDKPTAALCLADELAHEFMTDRRTDEIVQIALASTPNQVLRIPEARLHARLTRVRDAVAAFGPLA